MKKTIKRKPCPMCRRSGKKLWINKVWDGTLFTNHKYFIECPTCHFCGPTKVFLWRAIMAWNRREKKK